MYWSELKSLVKFWGDKKWNVSYSRWDEENGEVKRREGKRSFDLSRLVIRSNEGFRNEMQCIIFKWDELAVMNSFVMTTFDKRSFEARRGDKLSAELKWNVYIYSYEVRWGDKSCVELTREEMECNVMFYIRWEGQ